MSRRRTFPVGFPNRPKAIAGQRVDDGGVMQPVPIERLLEIRGDVTTDSATDEYARWARWLFADRNADFFGRSRATHLTQHPRAVTVTT